MIEQANRLSQLLAKELLAPILTWFYSRKDNPELELITTAHMTAILGCTLVLEELFGEEVLQPFMKQAKEDARAFASATRH